MAGREGTRKGSGRNALGGPEGSAPGKPGPRCPHVLLLPRNPGGRCPRCALWVGLARGALRLWARGLPARLSPVGWVEASERAGHEARKSHIAHLVRRGQSKRNCRALGDVGAPLRSRRKSRADARKEGAGSSTGKAPAGTGAGGCGRTRGARARLPCGWEAGSEAVRPLSEGVGCRRGGERRSDGSGGHTLVRFLPAAK